MRSPLQGGLPPADTVAGAVVEIACDESGFSGTNLLHPASPVITHASVDLRVDEAAGLITTLRSGFRFSPHEFKSGQFLRSPAAGEALEWFLTALRGRANVHLVDREYFLVTRIVDLLLAEPSYAAGTRLTQEQRPAALTLYRARHPAGRNWRVFLAAFVELFGGCHGGPDRKYKVVEVEATVVDSKHPIVRGIGAKFRINDEFYYRLKFVKPQGSVHPILRVPLDGKSETVAWAWQRPDGGRSFGFSGLHFHANWRLEAYRRLVAQGVLWTLSLPIPEKGLTVQVTEADLKGER